VKRPRTGYDALACAILQQAAEDWHAMVRAGAACPTGATGYWPVKREAWEIDSDRASILHSDIPSGRRAKLGSGITGPSGADELWHFITSDTCKTMCESVGISHSAKMRGLNVTPRHES